MIAVSSWWLIGALLVVAVLQGCALYAALTLWRAVRSAPLGLGVPVVQRARRLTPSEILASVEDQMARTGRAQVDIPRGEVTVTASDWDGWWLSVDGAVTHHKAPASVMAALHHRLTTREARREIVAAASLHGRLQ